MDKSTAKNRSRIWWLTHENICLKSIGKFRYSQTGTWTPNTFSTGTAYGVFFVDSLAGWAVGSAGKIFSSTDGGSTWSEQVHVASYSLFGAYFLNSNVGFAVGGQNTILKTTNGGAGWGVQNADPAHLIDLYQVYFASDQQGWILGGWAPSLVEATTDGGTTWTTLPSTFNQVSHLWSRGGANVFLAAPNVIFHTINGSTFTQIDIKTSYVPKKISFPSDSIGYGLTTLTTGYPAIIKTFDGGAHWDTLMSVVGGLQDIFFIDSLEGWVIGSNNGGLIYHTVNGGSTWTIDNDPDVNNSVLSQVFFLNRKTGWIAGKQLTSMIVLRYQPTTVGVKDVAYQFPAKLSLHQNYPNPFNPSTNISYELAKNSHVTIFISNILGQEVARPVDEMQQAGMHTFLWSAEGLTSGVYFYRIQAGGTTETRKLILMK